MFVIYVYNFSSFCNIHVSSNIRYNAQFLFEGKSLILVTGGAGFIGSNFVLDWLAEHDEPIINVDKLTYAGNLTNLINVMDDARHVFIHADINDREKIDELLRNYRPRAVIHFAAESHVDRSILGPAEFIHTNINGTFQLLEAVRSYWATLDNAAKDQFRFVHISTDEVYGSLGPNDPAFTENTPYAPNSPYSASKAASDHLVRAYYHTYGIPTLTTNCSNNYGPYQFPEKLIPYMLMCAVDSKPLPIYGNGENIRDWLYVGDHCAAIRLVLEQGRPGETYNIGGWNEKTNQEVVHMLCSLLDELRPQSRPYSQLVTYVTDRPGHDWRYAIDANKIAKTLNWKPKENFVSGLRKTVMWYLTHLDWVNSVQQRKVKS